MRFEMDELARWWADVWQWMVRAGDRVLSLEASDPLLLAGIGAAVVVLLLLAWLLALRRNATLTRRLTATEIELEALRASYDEEVRWRLAADKVFGRQSDPSAIGAGPPVGAGPAVPVAPAVPAAPVTQEQRQ